MAGLETSGSNPDVRLLYDINGLARDAPHWLNSTVVFLGQYGLPFVTVLLLVGCWWSGRSRARDLEAAASAAAAVLWAPLAAVLAVLVNVPIRAFVERPRPFTDQDGIDVLVHGGPRYSFVSDHATLTMAVAAALFVASRKFGLAATAVALAEGFCRVWVGVQYPTDVVGGFALGTAVALLLSPLATLALIPLARAVAASNRAARLVYAPAASAGAYGPADGDGPAGRPPDATPERPSAGPVGHERQAERRAEHSGAQAPGTRPAAARPAAPRPRQPHPAPGRRSREPRPASGGQDGADHERERTTASRR